MLNAKEYMDFKAAARKFGTFNAPILEVMEAQKELCKLLEIESINEENGAVLRSTAMIFKRQLEETLKTSSPFARKLIANELVREMEYAWIKPE